MNPLPMDAYQRKRFEDVYARYRRLMEGDWPAKRNSIIMVKATDVSEGRKTLAHLRKVMPWK